MANRKVASLKDGHMQVRGDLSDTLTPPSPLSSNDPYTTAPDVLKRLFPDERAHLLKDIPLKKIREAWVISSHLLLDDDAHVVEMGCGDGQMIYALALMKPNWTITAIDSKKDYINYAKNHYKAKNLTFIQKDMSSPIFPDNSVDAIINAFVLHEIYSEAHFNIRKVYKTLEHHYKALKTNGLMYIQDYTTPGPGEYVFMEMKEEPNTGETLEDLSEADLLIWFSDNVRSGDALTTGGFFLEELPPRFPRTRLFRLPRKWAYEFALRKNDRELLSKNLDTEYTFATKRDLRRELRSLGARLLYCSAQWDDDFVQKHMIDHFKLYKEDGSPLGFPETSYTILIQKVKEEESILYGEWRASRERTDRISIQTSRNNETGEVMDIASRHLDTTSVIPFYQTETGTLKILLLEETPRSIINTVPRQSHNIDMRKWSGHMIEPLSFDTDKIQTLISKPAPSIQDFIKKICQIKTDSDASFIEGPTLYPAPKSIDERISTQYIEIYESEDRIPFEKMTYTPPEGMRFTHMGTLRAFDAQSILNAIAIGLIPNAQLEIQILKLFGILNKTPTHYADTPLVLTTITPQERLNIQDTLADMEEEKKRFSPVKTRAGDIRIINSVFMEEGRDSKGGMTDISSKEQDFFIPEEDSYNIAVVLPLARDLNGEVMMGIIKDHAPVPERFQGNGTILNAPSFPLPPHVEDTESAKRYVAEMFEVDSKFVGKMGEPYFQHIGMTPRKIFPFAVTNLSGKQDYASFSLTSFSPFNGIFSTVFKPINSGAATDLVKIVGEAHKMLGQDSELSLNAGFSKDLYAQHTAHTSYESDFVVESPPSPTPSQAEKKPQIS